jgi:type II secretory pathway component PulF
MFLITKSRKQAILLHMRNKLDSGYQLSEVMQDMNRFFPAFYADLIAHAEASGRMEECFDFMMTRVRDSIESRNRIVQAMVYSLTSAFVCFGIIAFLAWKVFPVFQEIFTEFNNENGMAIELPLPWFLRSPELLLYSMLVFILGGAVLGFSIGILRRRGWNAGILSILGLCVPWFRKLTLHANLHQIALQLEMLLWAGMPTPQAITRVSESDLNFFYRRTLRKVARRVENGASLADAFAKHPLLFTRRFVDSLRLGEYSGQVPALLSEFSQYANGVVSSRSKVFFEMQQPIYTLVLAYFVASIMVYTFSLLTSIADAAVLW